MKMAKVNKLIISLHHESFNVWLAAIELPICKLDSKWIHTTLQHNL